MNELLEMLSSYFGLALVAVGAQNVVFTRALGISSGLRVLNDSRKNTGTFCAFLALFQLMTSVIVHLALPLVDLAGFGRYKRFILPAVIVVACTISYVIVVVVLSAVIKDRFAAVVRSVTSASISSAIIGTVILTVYQGLSLADSIVFGLGSSVGYLFAMILISEADRKIAHDKIPEAMQGLPIILIYISILALAVYGLTGHMITL